MDNNGAVQNLNRILAGGPNLTRKPWGMRDDGDVWSIVHELVQQRGPRATFCTKVKGHATDQMVADGRVRLQDQKGNAAAGTRARKALGDLAKLCKARRSEITDTKNARKEEK